MNDMLACVRRGWTLMLAAAVPLLIGGLLWTLLTAVTYWLLIGPAMVGLFRVALRAQKGKPVSVADTFAAFDDVGAPLVAGILLLVPFSLWRAVGSVTDPSAVFTVALFVHFAYFVHSLAFLADRPGRGVADAIGESIRLADGTGEVRRRMSALLRHLVLTSIVLLALLLVAQVQVPGTTFPFLLPAAGPLAICVLAAWHDHRLDPEGAAARAAARHLEDEDLALVPGGGADLEDEPQDARPGRARREDARGASPGAAFDDDEPD